MGFAELTVDLTAEEVLRIRYTALEEHNFSLLYASYHPRAPFLEQFSSAMAYLDFAAHSLSDLRLIESRVGVSRAVAEGVEQVCMLCFELGKETQTIYELALLKPTDDGWRYHSAQKLTSEDYQGEFSALDFVHFEQQEIKIRF